MESSNATKIYFLRRGRINLPNENLDILPSSIIHELQLVSHEQNISIDQELTQTLIRERAESVPFEKIETIYTAESNRCQQTAKAIQDSIFQRFSKKVDVTSIHLLNEVEFRVDKVFPEFIREYKTMNRSIIDQGIFRAMTSDLDWSESVKQCFWRVRYLFDILGKRTDHKYLVAVTHDYVMRVIEVFIRRKGDPGITIEDLMSTQRNHPLHGFVTDVNFSFFKPLPEPAYLARDKETDQKSVYHQERERLVVDEQSELSNTRDIYFIRHSKLNLPYNGHNYIPSGVIRDLSQSSLDPTIDKWFTDELIQNRSSSLPFQDVGVIFTAPSGRSQATASAVQDYIFKNFQKKVDVFSFPYLSEVKFSFQRIYPGSMDEFEKIDIDLLNQSVLKAMVAGQDCESLRQIYWKIDYFFEIIQKYKERAKILVITHDYLMRAIELYIKRRHFTTVTFEDILKTQRNSYLGGFGTDFSLSTFVPLPSVADG